MRLNPKKLEEVMISVLSEDGLPLFKELYGKENVSEFDLANRTKKDIKVVRKMLYLLYNNNLVCFTRKKDKEKGWYIYYWTLLLDSIYLFYVYKKREQLEKLKAHIAEEAKELFFVCKNNCIRLNFDQAMDFEFHCPECGELVSQDEKQGLEQVKLKIVQIEAELQEMSKAKRPSSRKKAVIKTAIKKTSKKPKAVQKKLIKKVKKKK